MPKLIEKLVYQFDELSDSAKEKARDWYREGMGNDEWHDFIFEDAVTIAAILGIEIDTHPVKLMGGGTRNDPTIYFSGFSSQGDGACFEGRYQYAKGAAKKVRKHTGNSDPVLNKIADELQAVQKTHGYRLEARVKHRGHYNHSRCTEIDVSDSRSGDGVDAATEETVSELLRDFMNWIYRQLEKEWNWRNEDAQVDGNIRANEYDFCEDGHRSRF